MNKNIKLTSTSILGTIIWALLIVLIVKVTDVGYQNNSASKQLVSGLAPLIVVFFVLKLIPTVRILKEWNNLTTEQKTLSIWGLISGDFIFSTLYLGINFKNKKEKTKN